MHCLAPIDETNQILMSTCTVYLMQIMLNHCSSTHLRCVFRNASVLENLREIAAYYSFASV